MLLVILLIIGLIRLGNQPSNSPVASATSSRSETAKATENSASASTSPNASVSHSASSTPSPSATTSARTVEKVKLAAETPKEIQGEFTEYSGTGNQTIDVALPAGAEGGYMTYTYSSAEPGIFGMLGINAAGEDSIHLQFSTRNQEIQGSSFINPEETPRLRAIGASASTT